MQRAKKRVTLVCIIRSSRPVHHRLISVLTHTKFRVRTYRSFRRISHSVLTTTPSLILLSLALPIGSNRRVYRRIHHRSRIPVVILASHAARVSRIVTVALNTSSFIPGPCDTHILITHVGTLLHHATTTNRHDALIRGKLRLSLTHSVIVGVRANADARLAGGRLHVLSLLLNHTNGVISHSTVVRSL